MFPPQHTNSRKERILRLRLHIHAPPHQRRSPLRDLADYQPFNLRPQHHCRFRHRHPKPRRTHHPRHTSYTLPQLHQRTFWTSPAVRSTHTIGYTYPEIADNNASCAIQAVNYLYGPSAGKPANQTLRPKKEEGQQREMGYNNQGCIANGSPTFPSHNALDTTFKIFVFLGDFNPELNYWQTDLHFKGSHTVFMPFSSQTQQNAGILVAGTVRLTKDLNECVAANGYDTANNTSLEAYLTSNLHWRVVRVRLINKSD